jgi:hypothetical protein
MMPRPLTADYADGADKKDSCKLHRLQFIPFEVPPLGGTRVLPPKGGTPNEPGIPKGFYQRSIARLIKDFRVLSVRSPREAKS